MEPRVWKETHGSFTLVQISVVELPGHNSYQILMRYDLENF